tara:strand:- start:256 stop:429 length:174 start_codon:yes stop_codon:yes gene_type:complete
LEVSEGSNLRSEIEVTPSLYRISNVLSELERSLEIVYVAFAEFSGGPPEGVLPLNAK